MPPLPSAYLAFLEAFAAGAFWEAHERLEPAWRRDRSGFYKGLILLASAFVHAGRGNGHGVQAQLAKAARELAPYAPAYLGQDVVALVEYAVRGQALAAARTAAPPAALPWQEPLPPPDLTPRMELFRGDEPELREARGKDQTRSRR